MSGGQVVNTRLLLHHLNMAFNTKLRDALSLYGLLSGL